MDKCFYCEREYTLVVNFDYDKPVLIRTKDHIHPRSKGGKGNKENIVYCCQECNKIKGDLTIEQLYSNIVQGLATRTTSGIHKKYGYIRSYKIELLEVILKNLQKIIDKKYER